MKTGFFTAVGIVMLTLFLASLHYSSANGAPNTTPTFTTSRFALLSGPYTVTGMLKNAEPQNENGIFKLDTYTGKTWKLVTVVDPEGRQSQKWMEITDSQP